MQTVICLFCQPSKGQSSALPLDCGDILCGGVSVSHCLVIFGALF